jgi:hypothetical protein
VHGLAPGQHVHELSEAARAGLRPLGGLQPIQDGVPVLAGQGLEHRCRVGTVGQRRREIIRDLDGGRAGVGGIEPAVGTGPLDRGQPRRVHPALLDQPPDVRHVASRPRAACGPWGEALAVGRPAAGSADLAVDPAEAQRLVQRLGVDQGGRFGGALARQGQPDSGGVGVVLVQPTAPPGGIGHGQLGQLGGHRPSVPAAWTGVACLPDRRAR